MSRSDDQGWRKRLHDIRSKSAELVHQYHSRVQDPSVAIRDGDLNRLAVGQSLGDLPEGTTSVVFEFWSLMEPYHDKSRVWDQEPEIETRAPVVRNDDRGGRPRSDAGRNDERFGRVFDTPPQTDSVSLQYDHVATKGLADVNREWFGRKIAYHHNGRAQTERVWMPADVAVATHKALTKMMAEMGWAGEVVEPIADTSSGDMEEKVIV